MLHGQRRRTRIRPRRQPRRRLSGSRPIRREAQSLRLRIRTWSRKRTSSTTPASAPSWSARRARTFARSRSPATSSSSRERRASGGPGVIASQASCAYKARLGRCIGSLSTARVRWLPGYASYNKPFIAVASVRGVRPGVSFGPVPVRGAQCRVGLGPGPARPRGVSE